MAHAKSQIRLFIVLAVIAGIITVLFALRLGADGSVQATHGATPGQIDILAVDADPTGNSATVIGAIDDCIAASPSDTLEVDIVIDEVHPNDGLAGVDFQFVYNPAFVSINSIQDSTGVLMSDDGSAVLSFSSAVGSDSIDDPDSDPEGTDGSIKVAAAEFGSLASNVGSGIAARINLTLSGTSGVSDLSVAQTAFADANNNPLPVIQTVAAQVASGIPCPGATPKTDIAVSDVVVDVPASAPVGGTFQVTADGLVANLGPDGPASVDVAATLSLPSDCTTTSPNPVTAGEIAIDATDSTRLPAPAAVWDVSCSSPSDHSFAVTISGTADPAVSVDNVAANNQAEGSDVNLISSDVDLKVTSFTITAPAGSLAGQPFDVTGSATIHNNGPLATAITFVQFDLDVPPACIIGLSDFADGGEYVLDASESVILDADDIHWRVRCNQPGPHTFNASGTIQTGQLHVTDSNPGNDVWNASTGTTTTIGACQEDTNPTTNPFQNLGPTLLGILLQLTAEGGAVPEEQQTALDCYYDLFLDDNGGGPVDDCESALIEAIPCDIRIDVGVDTLPGTPDGEPGTMLNPIAVMFLPNAFTLAGDLAVPNGADAGEASFFIRSDAGLSPNGGECVTDVRFEPQVGVEGGIRGNVPESNLDSAIIDPNLWPNDLNAEVALVEGSFDINPLLTELTLWSRTVVPLSIEGVLDLPLNVMIWRIDDPILQAVTLSRWVMVAFPGDALGPDAPGTIGGNPDADDPVGGSTLVYCTPFSESITLYGEVGGVVRNKCTSAGDQVGWALMDPNAVDFTGDDGTRSNSSPCSADLDNDGLTATEETYYGTNALNADSDGDGHQDGADNCPAQANAGQQNFDGDLQGDTCDPDIDGDGAANASDLCPLTTPGQAADSNGCSQAQVDADADGVCNPDAVSGGPPPACAGSDVCPSTQTGNAVAPNGCAQYQVDSDADGACNVNAPESPPICSGTDNCPNIANSDQSDVDSDGYGDACDGCPSVATAWPVPPNDDDCDGYTTAAELAMGTVPTVACGFNVPSAHSENWPPDLVATNSINISDVLALKPVFGDDDPPARLDLVPDGTINISDPLALKPVFGKSCTP